MYGATKLASELLIEEYRQMYDLNATVFRCGCLAGPWQMGKVDQGFIVLWASRHLYGGPLSYMGFGGKGHQVRDILHIDDLCTLVSKVMSTRLSHTIYNVGGGYDLSLSLRDATRMCSERVQRSLTIGSIPQTRSADIPWFVTDSSRIKQEVSWKPQKTLEVLFDDVFLWLNAYKDQLYGILGAST